MEGSLREFPNFKPVNCWFNYPIHVVDSIGVLSTTYAEGSKDANLAKSGKRKQTQKDREQEFNDAFDMSSLNDKSCTVKDLAEYMGVTERTIQGRIKEFSNKYISSKGEVFRK